ncbi:class I SAM-dependent methyltransferase [Testudinibacter aquarius]|uniref:Methyltransferase domain-containing protein n=1 Tax=Testudinibacter aquarius TaxID=1524974 RepID=A0A4R3YAL5_9PAST|nr:class I SAM-dependent methyltransferase [Testudinibacter aquarius]KAE9525706.1 hypothetical protein A1D24_03810 [Testudinibacter aquarius]TCV88731.1 methyltransferase family protein [Testudinibacter aquarius]TNG87715.1 methyltransferase domain-containing protein [Testudinibacter aquarius]
MKYPNTIHDIDFAELYRQHLRQATRAPKSAQDWDQKAEKMRQAAVDLQDDYVTAFLAKMALQAGDSVLDVGCGGGAIGLSLAKQVKQVYALDFSPKMLEVVQQRAAVLKVNNITPLLKSWDDDWRDVPLCDICVSSRSSMVNDLEAALNKLNQKAKRAVYMTMTVDKNFVAQEILQAIGRDGVGFPGYIYALNILYQQGYQVSVDFIHSTFGMNHVSEWDKAALIRSVQWSIGRLSEHEITKLEAYYHQHQTQLSSYPSQKLWALLSWRK